MEYQDALSKAWHELSELNFDKKCSVHFLSDTYDIEPEKKTIFSVSCNIPAKATTGILLLHFLIKKIHGMPPANGEWISFKELTGGEGYYPTFKKRVLDVIRKKYGENPEAIFGLEERFRAKREETGDASVVFNAFEGVPVLVTLWRGDDEFGPECNLLFDKSVARIFCTEDIVVLSEIVAHNI